jgi:hypothetical protein
VEGKKAIEQDGVVSGNVVRVTIRAEQRPSMGRSYADELTPGAQHFEPAARSGHQAD